MSVLPLTNNAFGFPAGSTTRRVKPVALMCVHITGNAGNLGTTAALGERNYANRAGSGGPSAHDYINRDGRVIEAIDPRSAAWSNGDINNPDTSQPIVTAVLALVARGYNANEAYYREVECVGFGAANPVTPAQEEAVAQLIAADAKTTGLPISRATVGTHADLNTVNRPSCAWYPADREAALARIIARAQALATGGGDLMPATKPTGRPIGTFTFSDATHALIVTTDTRKHIPFGGWPGGGDTFPAFASLDLKTPAGVPVDIEGTSPPLNKRDQVYLVDRPEWGAACYVLRGDGTFTAALDASPFTQADIDEAVAAQAIKDAAAITAAEAAKAAAQSTAIAATEAATAAEKAAADQTAKLLTQSADLEKLQTVIANIRAALPA